MSSLDPRTPVVVGVGQVTDRAATADTARPPIELMEQAVRAAAADAGTDELLVEAGRIIASAGVFRYADPARLVADVVGARGAATMLTNFGGNHPQAALAHLAALVAAGDLDVGIVMGGEAERSRRLVAAADGQLDTMGPTSTEPAETFGSESPFPPEVEVAVGAGTPAVAYALFESALRSRRGETIDENRDVIAALWSDFSRVAADNPHAWNPVETPAEVIRTPTPDNRMVAFPYTKAMCANPQVDMAAAVIVCSIERARALAIPSDRWVFTLSGATGYDTNEILARHRLDASAAVAAVAGQALDHVALSIDDVAHVDLYACFPSVVRITAEALGLGHDRPLTVTGGLNFGGGPLNNATTHAMASMVDRLRADPGSIGLVHGNGGVATKHSVGLYSSQPSAVLFADLDTAPLIDQQARRSEPDHVGPGVVAAGTVSYGRDGAESALAVLSLASGAQTFATSVDPDVMDAMINEDLVGRTVERSSLGELLV